MKKQIKTKRYNTRCARLIGHGIFKGEIVQLYMKKSGECFVVADSQITPISDSEASNFAQEHNLRREFIEALDYNRLEKKQVSIYLTSRSRKDLEEICKTWKLSFSEAIDRMIKQTEMELRREQERKQKLIDEVLAELEQQERDTENNSEK